MHTVESKVSGTRRQIAWKAPNKAYERLLASLVDETGNAWIVGGAVRDFILDQADSQSDLDVVIEQEAIPVARRIADRLGWAFYAMDPMRDIARLVFTANQPHNLVCDLSTMRGYSIEDDLASRDFTINSMAIEVSSGNAAYLIDPYGAQQDLNANLLRRVNSLSLSEDSIRLLRAPRLMLQFGLEIDSSTRYQIERLSDTVRLASPERVRDELWRMLATRQPRKAIELLDEFGLLHHLLPEVYALKGVEQTAPHFQDVYWHTLSVIEWGGRIRDWLLGRPNDVMDEASKSLFAMLEQRRYALQRYFFEPVAVGHTRAEWLVWHALFHDTGKPSSASVELIPGADSLEPERKVRFLRHEDISATLAARRLEALRFSRYEVRISEMIAKQHMRLHHLHNSFRNGEISRRATYRFFRDLGSQQSDSLLGIDVILLSLADYLGMHRSLSDDWSVYLSHAAQLIDDAFSPAEESASNVQPLVNGYEIMQHLNIRSGEEVGKILELITEAQAAGEITSVAQALQMAETYHSAAQV